MTLKLKTPNERRRERRRASWRSFFEDAVVVSVIGLGFALAATAMLGLFLGFFHVLAMVGA